MSNDMHYKGYEADIRYSECDGCFVGKVKGLSRRVAITFEGESVAELKADFQAAVDDYLALCASLGEEPERPYSGRFVVRMDSELHSAAAAAAAAESVSLNDFVVTAIRAAVGPRA